MQNVLMQMGIQVWCVIDWSVFGVLQHSQQQQQKKKKKKKKVLSIESGFKIKFTKSFVRRCIACSEIVKLFFFLLFSPFSFFFFLFLSLLSFSGTMTKNFARGVVITHLFVSLTQVIFISFHFALFCFIRQWYLPYIFINLLHLSFFFIL